MTIEELKDYVEEQRNLDTIPYHVYSTLIDGIDTLEQEPCEDAISRQATLAAMQKNHRSGGRDIDGDYIEGDYRESLYDDVISLPPVIPQPKTGHWIGHREHCENLGVIPSGLGAYEWCSNCDCGIDVREWHRNHYNFCPNCGADMRGEE